MTESLEFEWVLRPDSNPVLEHYVLHFHGVAQTWDDDAGDEVLVGRIAGHRVDLALARHDGIGLDELLDSVSHAIAEFKITAFADNNCYVPLTRAKSSDPQQHCECLVYIDEVVVEPAHRGKGVGSELFRRMSESIDLENCVIGLKAFPILEQPGAIRGPEEIEPGEAVLHPARLPSRRRGLHDQGCQPLRLQEKTHGAAQQGRR